jgi:hypothetical protein
MGDELKRPALMMERFELYRALVIPTNAPAVQVDECRRAFIAGAVEVYRFMMDASTFAAGIEPTDEDMKMMQALDDELRALAENEIRKMQGAPTHG